MQMLEDAIEPKRLDDMRKFFEPEMAREEAEMAKAEHAAELGRTLAARREASAELEDRNRHARRLAERLERLAK